jgi:hypothetical protein
MTSLLKPSALLAKGLRVQQINNLTLFKFTDELGDRLQLLLDKKKAETLTPEEHQELLILIDRVEQAEVDRLQHLIELAQFRQVPLPNLMQPLGIHSSTIPDKIIGKSILAGVQTIYK